MSGAQHTCFHFERCRMQHMRGKKHTVQTKHHTLPFFRAPCSHTLRPTLHFKYNMQHSTKKPTQETLLDSMQCVGIGEGMSAPHVACSSIPCWFALIACSLPTHTQAHPVFQV